MMKINKTNSTPQVILSVEECKIEIKGPAYSEDVGKIFDKITEWIIEEVPKLSCPLSIVIDLDIFNSVTQKKILFILSKLNEIYKNGLKMSISWYVHDQDEDTLDFILDVSEIFEIPVETINV